MQRKSKIKVHVIEGNELSKGSFFDKSDPYCKILIGTFQLKTKTHKDGGSKPYWNQSFVVDCCYQDSFDIQVYDRENIGSDKLMGEAKVLVKDVYTNGSQDIWVSLERKGKYKGKVHLIMTIAEPPPKYMNQNGMPKLNVDYVNWEPANQTSLPLKSLSYALPVVSSMDDFAAYNQAAGKANHTVIPPLITQAITSIQLPQYAQSIGIQGDPSAEIIQIFTRYEIPIGMLSKLSILQSFHHIHFVIDDSGSMGSQTDSCHPNGSVMSRWEEAQQRLKVMIELMAFIPIPPITIEFLNRTVVLELQRDQKHPYQFINEAWQAIDQVFAQGPGGGTPFYEKIHMSLVNQRFLGRKTVRYFFGDGVPNGGAQAIQAIIHLVVNRERPQDNPITLVSCTNVDSEVEWMKLLEEAATFTSEVDDFEDERREIQEDQGIVFPFTKGFYLVSLLVGAMNPYDLDAMDESVPFTKYSLDNLLGIQYSPQEYFAYFDCFVQTQLRKPIQTAMDQIKKSIDWKPYYNDFLTIQGTNNDIPAVIEFKRRLRQTLIH
jgi:hypothetical protein